MSLGAFRLNGISAAAAVVAQGTVSGGNEVSIQGDFVVRRFASASSSLIVSTAAVSMDYLLVGAGGGSSGGNVGRGGGGAGGLLSGTTSVSPGTTTVVIGQGAANVNGGNSTWNGLTASGGGFRSANGGSGGGADAFDTSIGLGTAGQGNNGGNYDAGTSSGGGGGGAGAVGANGSTANNGTGGNGGIGVESSISGVATYYAGGGAGATNGNGSATGGLGGGGNGARTGGNAGVNYLGGGAGGGGESAAGATYSGGHGIMFAKHAYNGDVRTAKPITVNGTAITSTAQAKFGSSSFTTTTASSGNSLRIGNATAGNINHLIDFRKVGTGDFTIEMWHFMLNNGSADGIYSWTADLVANVGDLEISTTGKVVYKTGNTARLTTTTSIAYSSWQHLAVVRSSGVTKIYLNGTADATTYTDSFNYGSSHTLDVGKALISGLGATGQYLDEFRMSSVARYTANFTPATAAFTNDRDTMVLLHFDGANNGTVFTDSTT